MVKALPEHMKAKTKGSVDMMKRERYNLEQNVVINFGRNGTVGNSLLFGKGLNQKKWKNIRKKVDPM